jgi:DNA-binding TFAR19-related protein (PDSD5 family)
MAKLIQREKQLQAEKEHEEKVGAERTKLLKRFLEPAAQSYLDQLKQRDPPVGRQVEDVVLYLLVYRGVRQIISQIDVRYIERQVRGEETKIRIQRDGEVSDFGQYVKEAIGKDNNK